RRRPHTIFSRDWSSHVCSSDLLLYTTWQKRLTDPKKKLNAIRNGVSIIKNCLTHKPSLCAVKTKMVSLWLPLIRLNGGTLSPKAIAGIIHGPYSMTLQVLSI